MNGDDGDQIARIDMPPPAHAVLALPPGARHFAIFGDAEEEFDWSGPFRRDAVATSAIAALPAANRQFVEAGCVPTYLVDWPVVADPTSADAMRAMLEAGECDIGTQLHPWVTPPHDEAVNARNSYLGNLPVALQRAKLAALTEKLTATFGRQPLSYRAGRYGVGHETAALLHEAGYRLDVSVRAGFDYSKAGGPDFSRHPIVPYRVSRNLFELPLTTTWTGSLHNQRWLNALPFSGLLTRAGMLRRTPLTPEGVPLPDALLAIRTLLDDGHALFSLSFHTPSVVPGHTPYVRDDADLATFRAWWDGVFALFAREGVTPIRSHEIVALLESA